MLKNIDLFVWIWLNLDAKLFKERRSESKELLQIIKVENAYERKYKLLEGAYEKLLSVRPIHEFKHVPYSTNQNDCIFEFRF